MRYSDPSHEDMDGLLWRFAAGDDQALGDIDRLHRPKFLALASRSLRRHGLREASWGDEDAVNTTLFKLWQAARQGKLRTIGTVAGFWSLFQTTLERTVLDARIEFAAQKRGGEGKSQARGTPAFQRVHADLDLVESSASA